MPVVPHLCPWAAGACGGVWGEVPAAWGLEEAGQGRVGAWAVQGPKGLSLSSPKGMGTVPEEQGQALPTTPLQLPCLLCQVTVSGLDQDSQDRGSGLPKCPGCQRGGVG